MLSLGMDADNSLGAIVAAAAIVVTAGGVVNGVFAVTNGVGGGVLLEGVIDNIESSVGTKLNTPSNGCVVGGGDTFIGVGGGGGIQSSSSPNTITATSFDILTIISPFNLRLLFWCTLPSCNTVNEGLEDDDAVAMCRMEDI